MSLRQRAFSAVRWTTLSAILRTALQIIQIATLARLLDAEDYGLLAMASVVTGLAGLFADMGLNSAFVQKQEVNDRQRSSLFWFSLLTSATVCVLLILASGLLSAAVFSDPRLVPVIIILAPTFVINALAAPVRLAAEKALQFRGLTMVDLASTLAAFAFAVALALADMGVHSLTLSSLFGSLIALGLSWLFLSDGWRPALTLHLREVRPFLGFGGALVANNIVNQINATLDIVLGGRLWGASLLGMYSLPRNLVMQIQSTVNPIITSVGFPLIAKVHDDPVRVRSIYLQTIRMTASTNAPVYVLVALLSPQVVMILWGEQWQESTSILQVLAAWAAVRSIGNPVGSLLMGMGRADLSLKWNLAMLLVVPPVVWFGASRGAVGLGLALLLMVTGMYLPMWKFLVHPLCGASLSEYSRSALTPLALACLAALPVQALKVGLDTSLLAAAFLGVSYIMIYLLLSWRFNRSWLLSLTDLIRGV